MVSLNVHTAFLYDYGTAMDFLLHFDEEIDIANPGAAELLIEQGVDPVDVAWRLYDALPNIISTDFNPNGSSRQIQASLRLHWRTWPIKCGRRPPRSDHDQGGMAGETESVRVEQREKAAWTRAACSQHLSESEYRSTPCLDACVWRLLSSSFS